MPSLTDRELSQFLSDHLGHQGIGGEPTAADKRYAAKLLEHYDVLDKGSAERLNQRLTDLEASVEALTASPPAAPASLDGNFESRAEPPMLTTEPEPVDLRRLELDHDLTGRKKK